MDGELRIKDEDLGVRLGFNRPRDIRKIIVRYLPELGRMGVCATASQTSGSKGGRPTEAYYLNRKQAIFITAKSETAIAADITIEIVERFDAYERGEVGAIKSPDQKPKRIRKPAFDVAFERCLRVASHLSHLDENQRLLMAARGTKELSGVNPLELMGVTSIAAPTQDNYLTPTQIGKEIGLSPIATNRLITTIGYQVKSPGSSVSSDYSMTEAGAKHGRMFDTTRRHGKGSQQQLKWSPNLVGILRAAMLADKDAPRPFAKAKEPAPA
ncbi:Rha family transcriptional regulator [Novacetimonas hansenii]|nr:Rha family transcriptional regulator [Novacetimonas hansenii]